MMNFGMGWCLTLWDGTDVDPFGDNEANDVENGPLKFRQVYSDDMEALRELAGYVKIANPTRRTFLCRVAPAWEIGTDEEKNAAAEITRWCEEATEGEG